MSLAEEPQLAGVHESVRSALEEDDARRWELIEWMERNGHGSTPWRSIPAEVLEQARRELGHVLPAAPRPVVKTFAPAPHPVVKKQVHPPEEGELSTRNIPGNIPAPTNDRVAQLAGQRPATSPDAGSSPAPVSTPAPQTRAENQQRTEDPMPRGAHPPCPGCGSTGRHKSVCPVKTGKAPSGDGAKVTKLERAPARKPKGREERALELYELDELVALRAAVTAELRKRKEQAENELEKLAQVIG